MAVAGTQSTGQWTDPREWMFIRNRLYVTEEELKEAIELKKNALKANKAGLMSNNDYTGIVRDVERALNMVAQRRYNRNAA